MDPQYDVIVVGAGTGGLVAAALLSRMGRKVLVLDQNRTPGGSAACFSREGYRFNVGLHDVGEGGPGERLRRILDLCGLTDLPLQQVSGELDDLHFPGFSFTVPGSAAAFQERLLERFPRERKGIDHYFQFLSELDRLTKAIRAGSRWRVLQSLARSPVLWRHARGTAGQLVGACTANPDLRALLSARSSVYGVAPGRVSALLHGGVANHYLASGAWFPEGGGQAIADQLAARVVEAGSTVKLRAQVESITLTGARASGVIFAMTPREGFRFGLRS